MKELVTYLQLTPEFGGTRFGPFVGLEVRLGSDTAPGQCNIVINASMGVLPQHAKLVRQDSYNLILTPAERTAGLYLYRHGTHTPQQVSTPTAVRPGDSFALVSSDGPRFVIQADEPPPEERNLAEHGVSAVGGKTGSFLSRIPGIRRLTAKGMANEGKRQIWSNALRMGPFQILHRAGHFIRSGAAFQPRYLFMYAMMGGGWIFGGMSSCKSRSVTKKYQTETVRVRSCNEQLDICQNMSGDVNEMSFEELAAGIVGIGEPLIATLREDDALRQEVKRKVKVHLSDKQQWKWLIRPTRRKSTEFAAWRSRLEKATENNNLDPDTARLAMWLGAQPGELDSEFYDMQDSEGDEVCVRGPLGMSYRQAISLGLEAQPDGLAAGGLRQVQDDLQKQESLLVNTMSLAGRYDLPETFETQLDPISQGKSACVFMMGEDDRMDPQRLMRVMRTHLGPEAPGLPPSDVTFAAAARIAKFWSGDLARVDYIDGEGINFSDAPPGTVLDAYENRGTWTLNRTADTIAKSVAVPCLMVMNGKEKDAQKMLGENNLPAPIQCLVLDWKMRHDD